MRITNYELRITNFKRLLLFCFIVFLFMASSSVSAHSGTDNFWGPGDAIVPCGGSESDGSLQAECNQCQILHLVRHIVDFMLLTAAPVLGTLFFIWAGVLMILGGANSGMLSRGKEIFKNTIIGIIIVMLAWLLTNTIIRSIAVVSSPPPITVGGVSISNTVGWFQFTCTPE